MKLDGQIFNSVLDKILRDNKKIDKVKLIEDANKILTLGGELMDKNNSTGSKKIGLVYGRVQSGKTNAMIASTALAFDNDYKIAIILTSNNTRLVGQTKDRFAEKFNMSGDYFITTSLYKDLNDLEHIQKLVAHDDERIIIVVPKGTRALDKLIECLAYLANNSYKTIVFDDEGDNYSLDNNRSDRDDDPDIEPTKINELIFTRLRNKIDHVLISVTGTPQGILLEGTNESLGFKFLLEPGDSYTGGETFFSNPDPYESEYVCVFDQEDLGMVEEENSLPPIFKNCLIRFFTAATLFNKETGDFGQFLCHPSQKTDIQNKYKDFIWTFWSDLIAELREVEDLENNKSEHVSAFRKCFDFYSRKLQINITFEDFYPSLIKTVRNTKIIQINSQKKDEAEKDKHHIVIGGNILGRGVTVENLLVMFYGRTSKSTNMDTLYQHARMFGYRKNLLKYMRIYMPEEVYDKFHATYETDEWLRRTIRKDPYNDFPIQLRSLVPGLKFTRPTVQSKSFLSDIFIVRKQFYPNHISEECHIKNSMRYIEMKKKMGIFASESTGGDGYYSEVPKMGVVNSNLEAYEEGVLITLEQLEELFSMVDVSSNNQFKGKTPISILKAILESDSDKRVKVFINDALKRGWRNGKISTGTLSQPTIDLHRKDDYVNVFFSNFSYHDRPELLPFFYPTIIFPERFEELSQVFLLND